MQNVLHNCEQVNDSWWKKRVCCQTINPLVVRIIKFSLFCKLRSSPVLSMCSKLSLGLNFTNIQHVLIVPRLFFLFFLPPLYFAMMTLLSLSININISNVMRRALGCCYDQHNLAQLQTTTWSTSFSFATIMQGMKSCDCLLKPIN